MELAKNERMMTCCLKESWMQPLMAYFHFPKLVDSQTDDHLLTVFTDVIRY